MNRIDIKAKARKLIERNLWTIWKPSVVVILIELLIGVILTSLGIDIDRNSTANIILNIILIPLTIGLNLYVLNFIRGKSYNINNIFSPYKNFLPIILITLIVGIFTFFGFVALIIPGIIIALMYSMVQYLLADGEISIGETLNKSQNMMKGYKLDYFIFNLSFFGWILLTILTLGLASIYVLPYITVANALYYDKLKKLKKINS